MYSTDITLKDVTQKTRGNPLVVLEFVSECLADEDKNGYDGQFGGQDRLER